MATPVMGAQGTYADVTGVIDATAAAEVVALLVLLQARWTPDDGSSAPHTDMNFVSKDVAALINAEVDAMAAAIAAAPTV